MQFPVLFGRLYGRNAQAQPPSCPIFLPMARSFKIESPISLHTSAPSKIPIVTSNKSSLSFFTLGDLLLNRIDFLECMIISIS